MIRKSIVGAICGIAAATTWSVGDASTRCEIGLTIGPRVPPVWMVLAEPLSDSISAPLHHFDWYDLSGAFSGRPSPADTTWGQAFRVRDVTPGKGDRIDITVGDTIIVVPWSYGSSCDAQLWEEGVVWATAGSQVFQFRMGRRVKVEGHTVFDVLGTHSPYPTARAWEYWNRDEAERNDWLSAEQYFDLLNHLARGLEEPRGATEAVRSDWSAALGSWIAEHPDLETAFPVGELSR